MADHQKTAVSFRLSPETVDKLNNLVENLNKISDIKITKVRILETLIKHTTEKELIKLIKFFD